MSDGKTRLPKGFEALEPFAATWAIGTLQGRDAMRDRSSAAERRAFYAAASDLLESALDYLDARPLAELDVGEIHLMDMMLSLAHVSLAEEIQHEEEPNHAHLRSFMPITRDSA